MTRVFICVLDGCGAGELPDAAAYGDAGSDTLRHVLERSDVELPNLVGLGLGEVVGLPRGAPWPQATYGRLRPRRSEREAHDLAEPQPDQIGQLDSAALEHVQ